jgi:LPS export ABC transporter protein LptC/lipopolysaccharide transport protein LptA
MTLNQIRLVKRLLAVVLVSFSALLAYQFLAYYNASKRPSSVALPTNQKAPMARGVEIFRLDEDGETVFELRAAESVGRTEGTQTFRDVEIRFNAGKTEPIPLTVTGDFCEYDVESSAVHLEGNVVIIDGEDLRIEAPTLDYRPKPKRVWTDDPIKYYHRGLSGEAGGLVYQVAGNAFELGEGVAMTFTPEDGGLPVYVESVWAKIRRRERLIRFIDDVRVRQGPYRLRSELLRIHMTEDEGGVEQLIADRDVRMVFDSPSEPPHDDAAPGRGVRPLDEAGRKRLTSERLEVDFRPDGSTMKRMRAMNGAKLTLEPPGASDKKPGMRRQLEGNTLIFQFDEEGRLIVLNGRGGVALTLEPEGGKPEDVRLVTARELESRFDPETGELRMVKCSHQVKFSHGDLHAEAEEGLYRAQRELLTLTESPRLWDASAELEAEEVRIQVVTGGVEAIGKVRSTMTAASSSSIGFLPGKEEDAVYFLAEHLMYDRSQDLAIYSGRALGFRGSSRLEAERIALAQTKGELEATDSVRTTFPQKPSPSLGNQGAPDAEDDQDSGGGRKETALQLTHTRAGHLLYRSRDGLLTYTKEVQMRSGDFVLRGEKIDVQFDEGGEAIKQIDAEGDVEIETITGKARGEKATYVPDREEVHITGELATLEDGDKLTEGKELTFFLSDDKIFIDGREERRTKTTYSGSRP